jgi:hypothetical protein
LIEYCEQLHAVGRVEVLNTLSNAGFAVTAAWLLFGPHGHRLRSDPSLLSLTVAIGVICAGSVIWHATQAGVAQLTDIVGIVAFVALYLGVAARRIVRVGFGSALLWVTVMFGAMAATVYYAGAVMNGSLPYVPALLAMVLLGFAAGRRDPPAARRLYLTALLFLVSLILRTIDIAYCDIMRIGTHWIWHLLNAWVLLRLMTTLVEGDRRLTPRTRDAAA